MTIAVAIALYNGERFIEEQLDSIRNQTLHPDKVILCDDNSSDNTNLIVTAYIDKYNLNEKWILIKNDKNLGYIKNFYKAISLCNTDIIFLSDQDDIWKLDKIEKMTKIMNENSKILLLSAKYGIIDSKGKIIHSLLEKKVNENFSIKKISIFEIMHAYQWPGMVMCIRNDFFSKIYSSIKDVTIPHDLIFSILASNMNGFYEFNYIGAYHRRHENNTAREEHRIRKLLNLERKLEDISLSIESMRNIIGSNFPLSKETYDCIKYKLDYMEKRETFLKNKQLLNIIKLYKKDNFKLFRKTSFICDVWLVLFGKQKNLNI